MTRDIALLPVVDCMTPFLLTVSRYDTLARAFETMNANEIRRIPVVDDGKLVGLIALSDILRFQPAEVGRFLTFKELTVTMDDVIVDLVMARDLVTVAQTDVVGYAAELMLDHKVGGLPVLDANGALAGLITESDIFRLLARHWRDAARPR